VWLVFKKSVWQTEDGWASAAHQLVDVCVGRFRWFGFQSQLTGSDFQPLSKRFVVSLNEVFGQGRRFYWQRQELTFSGKVFDCFP
jgi:hypothetical protein